MNSLKRQAIVLLWSHKPRSFFNFRPPVVHIQALFSPAAHLLKPRPHFSSSVFLSLIPSGMWLWLWRGCPVCALPGQSLQRGPEPAEVQTLPGLWTHQPLPEKQLFHHQQCRVWWLLAWVRRLHHVVLFLIKDNSLKKARKDHWYRTVCVYDRFFIFFIFYESTTKQIYNNFARFTHFSFQQSFLLTHCFFFLFSHRPIPKIIIGQDRKSVV